jgi:hypothetical protein
MPRLIHAESICLAGCLAFDVKQNDVMNLTIEQVVGQRHNGVSPFVVAEKKII